MADVAEVGEVVATMVEAGLAVSEAAAPEAAELVETIEAAEQCERPRTEE